MILLASLFFKFSYRQLNKANQNNLRMSCQNETWNPGHDECKHKSRFATNFDGNSSAEKRKYSLTS